MRKDRDLDMLANRGVNVAQFMSFDCKDSVSPNYMRIRGLDEIDRKMMDVKELIEILVAKAYSKCVNVRSFSEDESKGNRFEMGLTDPDEVLKIVKENAAEGRHSIVNENIDVADGGVSGVLMGDLMEFSPKDTPRCVEKEGVCSLPKRVGMKMLQLVYGEDLPHLQDSEGMRIEFSIHPHKQGYYQSKVIIWEQEAVGDITTSKRHIFPNNFSRFMGDKAYGLVLADALDIRVPKSLVLSKNVPTFFIGEETGNETVWMRPAPREKRAGLYDTYKGWRNPYEMMEEQEAKTPEYPDDIGAIIMQNGVLHHYSGSSIITKEETIIEGVEGRGDGFMVGEKSPEDLPEELMRALNSRISIWKAKTQSLLGDIAIEWVAEKQGDRYEIWVVQLNQHSGVAENDVIVATNDDIEYVPFKAVDGISCLRTLIDTIESEELGEEIGIEVMGDVGVTSHVGDLLRASDIPSFINRE